MSVCRFFWDDSDAYVFYSDRGIECCACALSDQSVTVETEAEMAEHLREHISAGHTILDYAFEGLGQPVPEGASTKHWAEAEREAAMAESRKRWEHLVPEKGP